MANKNMDNEGLNKVSWEQLLDRLKQTVPAGSLTSYKALSEHFYGHPNGTQAVVAMLNAAVAADKHNAQWTNRVIGADGKIVDVNGQASQLKLEGWSLPVKR